MSADDNLSPRQFGSTRANKCQTCGALPGKPCQTILYVRQSDGSYAPKGKDTRPHKGRNTNNQEGIS